MEQAMGGPVFIETLPDLQESGGIVRIMRNGEARAVMSIAVFEKYIGAGHRLIRDFHLREDAKTPIALGTRRQQR